MKLNTKMVTRVTFRIYDSEFGRQLDELLSKTKMSQQDFFTMLIREGYNNVYPRYASVPSVNSKEEKKDEMLDSSLKDIKDLIMACHINEKKSLDDIKITGKDLMAIVSCIYKMFLNGQDVEIQEDIEAGKFDGVPYRFKRVRDCK